MAQPVGDMMFKMKLKKKNGPQGWDLPSLSLKPWPENSPSETPGTAGMGPHGPQLEIPPGPRTPSIGISRLGESPAWSPPARGLDHSNDSNDIND